MPLLQILSLIGTYSLNLILISIFLLPAVVFFKYKLKKKLLNICFLGINDIELLIWTVSNAKDLSIEQKNLNFLIKIISPKTEIKKFFKI